MAKSSSGDSDRSGGRRRHGEHFTDDFQSDSLERHPASGALGLISTTDQNHGVAAQTLPLKPASAERSSRKPDARIDQYDAATGIICPENCLHVNRSAPAACHAAAAGEECSPQAFDERGAALAVTGTGDGNHKTAVTVGILHPLGQVRPGVRHRSQEPVNERVVARCRDGNASGRSGHVHRSWDGFSVSGSRYDTDF
jgi:hypothetical protein